jgi:hypothetical protein
MTSKEFVIWMKGIIAASSNYNIIPATWDTIKETIETVDDGIPISETKHQVFNTYTALHGTNTSSTIK